jgi:hypothetical protein
MRFMMMMKADADSEAGRPPDPRLEAAVRELTEEMTRAGVVLAAGGLGPSSQGARVQLSGGKVRVLDGPFAEAKELIGGYAILEVSSREEAIAWGTRMMELHRAILGADYEGQCEIRQIFGPG